MTIQDDIINAVQQGWTDPAHSFLGIIINLFASGFVIIGVIIGAFIVIRAMLRYKMYAGRGTAYGSISIHYIDGTGMVHGNLSRNTWFNEENFNKIKRILPEWYLNYDEFIKSVELKETNIYDFKETDHDKVWTFKDSEKIVIIANGKIESDEFSAIEKIGRFSITSSFLREHARSIGAYTTSKSIPSTDPHNQKITVLLMDLIPQNPTKSMRSIVSGEVYEIKINTIFHSDAIAKSVISLPSLIQLEEAHEQDQRIILDYRKLVETTYDKMKRLNALLNKANYFLTRKMFVGNPRPQTPGQKASEIMFVILGWVAAVIGYEILPKTFPSIPPIIFSIAGLSITILLRNMWKKQQQDSEEVGPVVENEVS